MKAKLIKDIDGYWLDISDDNISKRQLSDFGQLSIKNCEAIANGYDLDELANKFTEHFNTLDVVKSDIQVGYKAGFQKALEIIGDKKYSEEDVLKELNKLNTMPTSTLDTFTDDGEMVTMKWFEQSLQRTEWDVEIVTKRYTDVHDGFNLESKREPKLDSDGCLILKKIII